jgi:hypothetical protein
MQAASERRPLLIYSSGIVASPPSKPCNFQLWTPSPMQSAFCTSMNSTIASRRLSA